MESDEITLGQSKEGFGRDLDGQDRVWKIQENLTR
jgi:hypothetical protein